MVEIRQEELDAAWAELSTEFDDGLRPGEMTAKMWANRTDPPVSETTAQRQLRAMYNAGKVDRRKTRTTGYAYMPVVPKGDSTEG